MTLMLIRTSLVADVPGGMAAVLRNILDTTFFDSRKHDMSLSGVRLRLHDGTPLHIFISFEILLADESAIHALYGNKGSARLKPCLLCQNVFNANDTRGVVAHDTTGFAVYHTCTEISSLVLHTPGTIEAILKRLSEASRLFWG